MGWDVFGEERAINQFDAISFRKVLSTFTTGVTIVTTRDVTGVAVGITVNSFNSVSLQPPLVLWSIAKTARSLQSYENAKLWAVHILSADQESLSNRFARSGEDKFAGVDVDIGQGGIPLLRGCSARLQCKSSFRYDGGDHVIFIGEVIEFEHDPVAPLVFQLGKYAVAGQKLDGITLDKPDSPRFDLGFDEDFLGYLLARSHFQFFARMRELMARLGLDDVHVYVLFGLSVNETRSLEELNRMIGPARQEITPEALQKLQRLGYMGVEGDAAAPIFRLTKLGHEVARDTMAECKAIECTMLDEMGYWNANAFKSLLKQFIVQSDIGEPHPWESSAIQKSSKLE